MTDIVDRLRLNIIEADRIARAAEEAAIEILRLRGALGKIVHTPNVTRASIREYAADVLKQQPRAQQ